MTSDTFWELSGSDNSNETSRWILGDVAVVKDPQGVVVIGVLKVLQFDGDVAAVLASDSNEDFE